MTFLKLQTFLITSIGLVSLMPCSVAKRLPPKPVSPVVSGGIRYSAAGNGKDQNVVATDVASGKVLWQVRVFHNEIEASLEEDVQWIYITDLKVVDRSLLVKDERSRCYSVDLRDKRVTKRFCGWAFSP